MSLTLFGAPLSPFVRKVMYLLALAKADYKLKVITPGAVPEDFINISPLKRIPVLQDGDWTQADSSIICNYLVETLGNDALTQLVPSNPQLRAHMQWLEKFADYELAPTLTFIVFRQRVLIPVAGKAPNEELIHTTISQKIPPLFDYLASQLGNQDYFVDNKLSLADIAITSQIINFMLGGERIDAANWPTLSAYFNRMMEQPIWHTLVEREEVTLNKISKAIAAR